MFTWWITRLAGRPCDPGAHAEGATHLSTCTPEHHLIKHSQEVKSLLQLKVQWRVLWHVDSVSVMETWWLASTPFGTLHVFFSCLRSVRANAELGLPDLRCACSGLRLVPLQLQVSGVSQMRIRAGTLWCDFKRLCFVFGSLLAFTRLAADHPGLHN